jgi:biotin synthase
VAAPGDAGCLDRPPTWNEILGWLHEEDEARLEDLWRRADAVRQRTVGDAVYLRGLVEISNHCVRRCGYCGIRAGKRGLQRYRMTGQEIVACAHQAEEYGYGTVVLQSGEDYDIAAEWLAGTVRRIKAETSLAVTLSLGERPEPDLAAWREAGADRYLLRFETSDPDLYRLIHPSVRGRPSDRLAILRTLNGLGYETGSGVMVGIPGQSFDSLANDIDTFRSLDLDMVGVGPYISHPATPLGKGKWIRTLPEGMQVPNTEMMVYKVVALTRLACPEANIPSTTALATINRKNGRELGLARGANVVMPNLTPPAYRGKYEIYPGKACINETADACRGYLRHQIEALGRQVGAGPGGRRRRTTPGTPSRSAR